MLSMRPFTEVVVEDHKIQSVVLRRGHEKRPIWPKLHSLTPHAQVKWIDRLSTFEALSCEWALVQMYENALKIKVSRRTEHLRVLLAELQRVLWSFHYLSRLFLSLGDRPRYEQALRLREYLFQGQEIFTGSRVLPQALVIGGIERDFTMGEVRKFRDLLKNIEFEVRLFFKDVDQDLLLQSRLEGLLGFNSKQINEQGWTGLVATAAGVDHDIRIHEKYSVYGEVQIQKWELPKSEVYGDALARLKCTLHEVRQSMNICYNLLLSIPDGATARSEFDFKELNGKSAIGRVQGASGIFEAKLSDGKVSFSTPTQRVSPYLEDLMVGLDYEDLEVAFASLGVSFEELDAQ